eukprot:scaffold241882_cov13-Tisochrysis_lutea.AAC.1
MSCGRRHVWRNLMIHATLSAQVSMHAMYAHMSCGRRGLAHSSCSANPALITSACIAWLLASDHSPAAPQVVYKRKAERNLSSTLDLNVHCCSTKKHKITFTDTPGAWQRSLR